MARSRLFSNASRIAFFSEKYSLPSRTSWVSSREFVSCGSGTSLDEYALKGLRDLGISKDTDAFVCADAAVVRLMSSHAANCFALPGRRGNSLIASPPHTAATPDWRCRRLSTHRAVESC